MGFRKKKTVFIKCGVVFHHGDHSMWWSFVTMVFCQDSTVVLVSMIIADAVADAVTGAETNTESVNGQLMK